MINSKIINIASARPAARFAAYLLECEYSAGTIARYTTAVAQYAAFAGTDKPDKTALLRWKRRLTETKRPATVNLRIAAINRWCRFMNADIELKPLKLQRRTTVENVITVDDYHKLIDGLERDGKTRWAAFYKLLGQTGVRVSELLNIRRSDLVRGYMEMFSKGKVRRVLFPAKLTAELLPIFTESCICLNARGKKLTDSGIRKMLRFHAAKYGIPPECAHPHAFRHMFAIEFLKNNSNIALLADLLGHSSVNTTGIYLRLSQKEQQQAVDDAVTW